MSRVRTALVIYSDCGTFGFPDEIQEEVDTLFGKMEWRQEKEPKFRSDPRLHAILRKHSWRRKYGKEETEGTSQRYVGDYRALYVPQEYIEAGAVHIITHGYECESVNLDHAQYKMYKVEQILKKQLRNSDKVKLISRITHHNKYEHFNVSSGEIELPEE